MESMRPKMRVGYYPVRENKLSLWIADETKLFEKHRLQVELRSDSRGQTISDIVSQNLDIGIVGFRAAIDALAAGADLGFVASLAANPFIFLGAPDIQSPQHLRGKKIWTARPGTGPDTATRLVLAHLQLDAERDVELLPYGDHHFLGLQWLLENKVAATLSNRSTLMDLNRRGNKVTLLADF